MTVLQPAAAMRAWQPGNTLRRPEFAALVAVGLAWPAMLALEVVPGPIGVGLTTGRSIAGAALAWAVMAAAMMGPIAIPAARYVALNSLRRRRHQAVLTFLAAFVGSWVAVGLTLSLALAAWRAAGLGPATTGVLFVVALGVAAGWQLTDWKRSALRSCQRGIPLPPRGWRATMGSARFGAIYAGRCVRSCWALMLVMAVAGQAHLTWALIITLIVVAERFASPVRQAPWIVATGLAAIGALAIAAGVAGAGGAGADGPAILGWICPITAR